MSEVVFDGNGPSELEVFELPSIPSSWCWATPRELSSSDDYALAIGPFGSNLKVSDYRDRGVPLIFVRNIRSCEYGGLSSKYISEGKAAELAAHTVDPGDVLVTKMGDPPGDAAVYRAGEPRAVITADCIKFRVDPRFGLPRFFAHAINSRIGRAQIALITSGVAQQKVSLGRFVRLRFPVPPLAEQSRIVAKIEELFSDLDAGVAALKRAKANLKRYRAAVLKAAVEGKLTEEWRAGHPDTEPAPQLLDRILSERRQKWEADQLAKFAAAKKEPPKNWKEKYVEPTPPDSAVSAELPHTWCWARMDQVLCYLRNGYFQSPAGATNGTPILRISAVRPMKLDLSEARFLDRITMPVDDFVIDDGDLLFTRYNGSVDLLGVAAMVRGCSERTLHPDKLIRVKLVSEEPMPSFVEIAANVGVSRAHIAGRARTTAGQSGISGPDVREMPLPIPPLEEQRQIVERVAERLSMIETAESAIEHDLIRASRLRQSILKQAFEGKLVPQDPADEPGSVLLERLRSARSVHAENGSVASSPRPSGRRARAIQDKGAKE